MPSRQRRIQRGATVLKHPSEIYGEISPFQIKFIMKNNIFFDMNKVPAFNLVKTMKMMSTYPPATLQRCKLSEE